MTEKSDAYWRERFEQLEDALHSDIEKLMPDIDRLYKTAQSDIEKEIRAWYQRLADNNGVSMAEARKLLSAGQLQEFKWSVGEYIKYGKENAIDQRWTNQLENASAKFHISRLEALKLHIQQSIEQVYGNQLDMLDESMRELYQEGYYRTAFEVQKGFNIGWPVAAVDQNKLDKVIRKPWAPDRKNFSNRISDNKTKLINEVHTEISRMCITGEAPDKAIKNIAKKMNTSRYNAGRLVMTEAAYFGSVSQKDCFNDLGVEQYQICATLDHLTSDICREMDGTISDMKKYEPGVTAPPFHVFCRSCTCPYFDDEFTAGEMRAARGEDGKTYYVPADMKYEEWKEKYAGKKTKNNGKNRKRTIENTTKSDIIKTTNSKEDVDVHFVGKIDREIYKCVTDDIVTDEVIITDERIAHIKERHPNDFEMYCSYLKKVIESPDFIIESNKRNTALILKEFKDNGGAQFKTVLRLKTSTDNPQFKNSIITFMKINKKEWDRLIRNKQILYKKE